MLSFVESWQQSFCREHNIAYSTFHYWLGKFKKEHLPSSGFVEMKITRAEKSLTGLEIIFPSGAKMSVDRDADITMIRSLIL